jgi:hypothetical protein
VTATAGPDTRPARGERRANPVTRADRDALLVWGLSRLSLLVAASSAAWLLTTQDDAVSPPVERWLRWDAVHLVGIATHGYGGQPTGVPNEAFFPAVPVLMRLGGWLGVPETLVGLALSAAAGGVAAVALSRLAEHERPGAGRWAVLLWVAAPPAVFLAAPYTEALFCALAFPAWLAARRARWGLAVALGAAASTVRVSGAFLAVALAVQWLTTTPRRWRQAPLLLVPLLPVLGYFGYLRWRFGSWTIWFEAQRQEWHRDPTWPWTSIEHTLDAAFGLAFADRWGPGYVWMLRAELVALVVGVLLLAVLLARRRWGEATWVGVQVAAFVTSYWLMSLPRATLLWWPLWVLPAAASVRRPWLGAAWLAVTAPLMVVWTVIYLRGSWAG